MAAGPPRVEAPSTRDVRWARQEAKGRREPVPAGAGADQASTAGSLRHRHDRLFGES